MHVCETNVRQTFFPPLALVVYTDIRSCQESSMLICYTYFSILASLPVCLSIKQYKVENFVEVVKDSKIM